MKPLHIVLLGLLLASAQPAAAQWNENGRPAPDTSWRKTDGDLGAMLLVTDDLQSFLEAWEKPASPEYRPHIDTTDEAHRGDTVAAVILFTHCTPAESGSCRAVVDFRLLRPDGSVYAEHTGAPLWDDSPPLPGHLQLGLAQLAFEVERDDPLGEYRLETRIRDLVSLESVALTRSITVVEPGSHAPAQPDR